MVLFNYLARDKHVLLRFVTRLAANFFSPSKHVDLDAGTGEIRSVDISFGILRSDTIKICIVEYHFIPCRWPICTQKLHTQHYTDADGRNKSWLCIRHGSRLTGFSMHPFLFSIVNCCSGSTSCNSKRDASFIIRKYEPNEKGLACHGKVIDDISKSSLPISAEIHSDFLSTGRNCFSWKK